MIREDILLGVTAAYRESFHVFTFRICFMTQPASRYTYCQSKARYSWSIFQKKTSSYKPPRRPVHTMNNFLSCGASDTMHHPTQPTFLKKCYQFKLLSSSEGLHSEKQLLLNATGHLENFVLFCLRTRRIAGRSRNHL